MNKQQTVILLWFCGVTGILFIMASIFIAMIPREKHEVVLYEPSNVIFWVEVLIIIILFIITFWLLFKYITKSGYLDLIRK